MKKATNINELANNLIPENFLTEADKDVYVPIYEDILETLRNMVLHDQVESQTFFVAGQAGTGKTTALNFIKTDALENHYHVKYINMRDFLDLSDVDIIDFLLAFAFALVKDTVLEGKYYKDLEEIQGIHEGEISKEVENQTLRKSGTEIKGEFSAGGGFLNFVKLKAGVFSNMRIDRLHRENTRKVFRLKKPSLHAKVNELLDNYMEKVAEGKNLLVIIDDLDKLQDVKQINSIFIENRNYVFNLKCKKIISIPTYLSRRSEILNYTQHPIRQFVLRLSSNPIDGNENESEKDKKKTKTNRERLGDVIKKRVEKGRSLIHRDALEKAIDYSGGILRQLIRIIRVAAVSVRIIEGKKISLKDVNDAIQLLKDEMVGTIISKKKIRLLNTILLEKIPVSETAEDFIELLQSNNVLAYVNGDPWFEVNPIIENTVKVYASRREEK